MHEKVDVDRDVGIREKQKRPSFNTWKITNIGKGGSVPTSLQGRGM